MKIQTRKKKKKKKKKKKGSLGEGRSVYYETVGFYQASSVQGHARLESETVPSVHRPQCGPWSHRRRIVATPLHTGVPPRPVDSRPMSRIYLPHRSHPFDDERGPIRAAACNKRGWPIFIAGNPLIKKRKKERKRDVATNFEYRSFERS